MSWGFIVMWLLLLTMRVLKHNHGLLEFFHGYHRMTPFHGISLSGLLVGLLAWNTSRGIAAVTGVAFSSDETKKSVKFLGVSMCNICALTVSQSPCTVRMAGICLPFGLCKGIARPLKNDEITNGHVSPGYIGRIRHRGWAITACITAHAWRTCRDACWDR